MSWSVTIEPEALNQIAGFLAVNPRGAKEVFLAIDGLEEDPAPDGSSAWGSSHRRLHAGPWRILYRIEHEPDTVHVEHVGHSGS